MNATTKHLVSDILSGHIVDKMFTGDSLLRVENGSVRQGDEHRRNSIEIQESPRGAVGTEKAEVVEVGPQRQILTWGM